MPISVYLVVSALTETVVFLSFKKMKHTKSPEQIMQELDLDHDNEVSLQEFQIYMLAKLGRVDDRLLHLLELQYNRFNRQGHGLRGNHLDQKGSRGNMNVAKQNALRKSVV